jgi:glycosyltransferase involved in cell wall biosynthesis
MRLLIYSHFFAPSIGGVETIVRSLAGGLAERRGPDGTPEFAVTVVTQTAAREFDDRSLAFPVVRQPSLIHLYRLIRGSDVIHSAGPALPPLLLAKLARKPVVIEHHGYQAICPNGILIQQPDGSPCPGHFQDRHYLKCLQCSAYEVSWVQSLKRLGLMLPRHLLTRGAARSIAVTQYACERHALPDSTVIYHGIEDSRAKHFIEHPLGENSRQLRFAFVGRFVPEKGTPILLEAARILRDEGQKFELLLIGDGPERTRLEAQIARDGLEHCVHMTGFLQNAGLEAAFEEVQVVVMPSVWEETAGLSAIEQMMRGRLVIASRIGGLGEVVGDAGLLCEPGDAPALADCMRRVLYNTSLVHQMGGKARERALQLFQRRRMIDEHASAYQEVFHGKKIRA